MATRGDGLGTGLVRAGRAPPGQAARGGGASGATLSANFEIQIHRQIFGPPSPCGLYYHLSPSPILLSHTLLILVLITALRGLAFVRSSLSGSVSFAIRKRAVGDARQLIRRE